MKSHSLTLLALALTAGVSAPALAQDGGSSSGLEPYVGVMGGLHDFDNKTDYDGAPPVGGSGAIAEGVAGVNYNLGKFFVGAEGSVAKGVDGDIDWEYGAAGRVGVRAGKDSLFFVKAGYQWTEFALPANGDRAYHKAIYGFGTEVSLADLGGSADKSNIRLRGQIDTRGDFHSFRPMLGVVAKF
jgi:outer membrane immunogenic protein